MEGGHAAGSAADAFLGGPACVGRLSNRKCSRAGRASPASGTTDELKLRMPMGTAFGAFMSASLGTSTVHATPAPVASHSDASASPSRRSAGHLRPAGARGQGGPGKAGPGKAGTVCATCRDGATRAGKGCARVVLPKKRIGGRRRPPIEW
jgi:hypothetical protein